MVESPIPDGSRVRAGRCGPLVQWSPGPTSTATKREANPGLSQEVGLQDYLPVASTSAVNSVVCSSPTSACSVDPSGQPTRVHHPLPGDSTVTFDAGSPGSCQARSPGHRSEFVSADSPHAWRTTVGSPFSGLTSAEVRRSSGASEPNIPRSPQASGGAVLDRSGPLPSAQMSEAW